MGHGTDEELAESEQPKQSVERSCSKNGKAAVIIALVIALLLAVVVPTTVTRKNKKSSSGESEIVSTQTNASTSLNVGTSTNDTSSTKSKFVLMEGTLNSTFELLSDDIVNGYENEESLKSDLAEAAKFLISSTVLRNKQYGAFGARTPNLEFDSEAADVADFAEGAPTTMADSTAGTVGDDVNDFGTNNQEEDVEEGDLIVSDGEHVYAAYGDHVLVWDTETGETVTKLQMPSAEEMRSEIKSRMLQEFDVISDIYYYEPKPNIVSLLLQGSRLLVIVQGYQDVYSSSTERKSTVLNSYLATQIRLYDISSLQGSPSGEGTLSLVGFEAINGHFNSVRAVNNNVHVVTSSGINTYDNLVGPFELYQFDNGELDKDSYETEVQARADENIEYFVDGLLEELQVGGSLPNMARINVWQDQVSDMGTIERSTYSNGFVSTVVLIHSLDMAASSLQATSISTSGAFLSSYDVQVYSSAEQMILASRVWEYDETNGESSESTALMGVALDGASATPHSVGKVKGYIPNSHSIDVVGRTLRVATSIQQAWFMVEPFVDFVDEGAEVEEDFAIPEPTSESRTENYVILLDLPEPNGDEAGVMKELGRLKLGKPNELITAARFFDNIAYAVTFERRDPFYVLDLSDPSNPAILAELDISGFSSYLHSLNDDNSVILAIGQETDDDGIVLGLQITVFDVTDPTSPVAAARHVLEKDPDTYSSSDSLWDFKATRFAAGRLILPVDISSYNENIRQSQDFRGFKVFVANENEVYEECEIEHGPGTEQEEGDAVCYYCQNLPRRSMIFQGNLMTTQGQTVKSTDLGTCAPVWTRDILIEDSSGDACCGYWW